LQVADSRAVAWNLKKDLIVRTWKGSKKGGGADRISFGNTSESLTLQQLARVGFRNPAGYAEGLYTAQILKTGELVPNGPVQPVNPPYDVSDAARAERQKAYAATGRASLSGKGSPLKNGMKIAFFGDSITWGGGYISVINQALKSGEGTKELGVKLINHGVNGGGVLTLRDGDIGTAHVGNTKPRPFAENLADDKPDAVVIYIGVNDVWWRKTSPADFEKALTDLVTSAKTAKAVPVLATLSVWGDDPTQGNANNPKCDEYAAITRKVATATGATLVDLRKAFISYLMNHNPEMRLDGSLRFFNQGILTGDGVHATAKGNELLADQLCQGLYEALKKKETP
ncbi:MAG: GDSL-type esterase/lipase family protein, partial [bacterium]